MTRQIDKRLKQLESSSPVRKRPCFWYVPSDELVKWKEILTVATNTGEWSHYFSDLAKEAPSVYEAFRKAGWCE